MRTPAEERLYQRVSMQHTGYIDPKTGRPSACFIWDGAQSDGYGLISVGGELIYVHVYAHTLRHGKLPRGQYLDHLCRTRACLRTEHLEPVSNKENTLRGEGPTSVNAAKTHCLRGHEFTEANTLLKKNPDGTTRRQCRACGRQRHKSAPPAGDPTASA